MRKLDDREVAETVIKYMELYGYPITVRELADLYRVDWHTIRDFVIRSKMVTFSKSVRSGIIERIKK